METIVHIIIAAFGLLFAAAGVFFIAAALKSMRARLRSRAWSFTEGTVLSAEVKIPERGGMASPTAERYVPAIAYEYEVDGTRYRSDRIWFTASVRFTASVAQRTVNRYPAGSRVRVYYDPRNPESAVLDREPRRGNAGALLMGTALILFGCGFAGLGIVGLDTVSRMLNEANLRHIIPPMAFAAGGLVLILGIRQLLRARSTRAWPWTEGVVVASGILRDTSSSSGSGTSSRTTSTYQPAITYRYNVNGVEYMADTLSFGNYASSNIERSKRVIERYPEGATVKVFYDPEDPGQAVLEHGTGLGIWLPIITGVLFMVVAALFASCNR